MDDRVPLRSVISSYIGGGWGKEEIEDGHPEPAYVIRGTDFGAAEYGSVESVPYRFHKTSNLASRRLAPNEIVMEVSGGSIDQPVGRVMLVDEHVLGALDGPVMCASFCKRIVPDAEAVFPSYLYWYLQAVYASGLIERYQVQSTGIRNLQFEYLLDDLPVHFPPRDEQERAVAVLDAVLEAVRSNRRRIEILEEMARLIYREWFVHFRFPGHEDVELVESDLGPIPEGWERANLFELADVGFGFSFKSGQFTEEGPFPVLRIRDIPNNATHTFTDEEAGDRYLILDGDILIGMDGDFHMCRWASGTAYLNQRVTRIRTAGQLSQYQLFLALEQPIRNFNGSIIGTTVAHLGKRHLQEIEIAVPSADVLEAATGILQPMFYLEIALRKQNRVLSRARDLLLPRLISGELDVSDLDLDLEPVA